MGMEPAEPVTIVHTKYGICLTTKRFESSQDTEADFEGYSTSHGPFSIDEVLDYLKSEYPDDPPFGRLDVIGLAHRANAYSWAAVSPGPVGDGLALGTTDGDSLRLAIDGLQFPESEEPNKRFSWYFVDGSATQDGRAWDFRWQALTCDKALLICGWLFEVANWIGFGPRNEPPPPPWLVEPNLHFPELRWENGRALLTVELDLEFLPPEIRDGRRGTGNPQTLRIRATAEELRSAAIAFAATIARYPATYGPSQPVEA